MIVIFQNPQNVITGKFKEMIDKLESVREKTDDYELIKQAKYILGKDYYKDARLWLTLFRNAEWYRTDLI